jgi:hypothetical protein
VISISPLPELRVLGERWRQLAAGAPHSFFLSWPRISTWLHCIQPTVTPMFLSVSSSGQLLAPAIVVKKTIWRHNLLPVRTWVLNASGDRRFDSICTEHNGLLTSAQHGKKFWTISQRTKRIATSCNSTGFRLDLRMPGLRAACQSDIRLATPAGSLI